MLKEPRSRYHASFLVCVMAMFLINVWPSQVWACSLSEPPAHVADTLWVHLEGLCFSSDQHEWAVKGADVLDALKAGKNLDFQGVLVVDDVMLDQLPLQSLTEVPNLPNHIREDLQQRGLEAVRVIPGAISIRDSQFEKVLATNLVDEALVILGQVDVSGTTFSQSMDFSKIIFVKPVMFSNVNVQYEGFFIGAQFEETADFSGNQLWDSFPVP